MRGLPVLDDIRIASPCTESWDAMTGDDRTRHCAKCDLDVFNLSGMTRADATALLQMKVGRMCARFYRRPDGTILTADCPVGARAAMRRVVLAAGAWVSMMTAGIAAFAGVTVRNRLSCHGSDDTPTVLETSTTLQAIANLLTGKPIPTPGPMLMGAIAPMPYQVNTVVTPVPPQPLAEIAEVEP